MAAITEIAGVMTAVAVEEGGTGDAQQGMSTTARRARRSPWRCSVAQQGDQGKDAASSLSARMTNATYLTDTTSVATEDERQDAVGRRARRAPRGVVVGAEHRLQRA